MKTFFHLTIPCLLALAACNTKTPPHPPDPAEELANLRIAYNVLHDKENDDYEVFTMKPDGTDKRNVTNALGVEWVYAAHGDKIYWISDRDTCHRCYFLYESDAFGKGLRKVSEVRLDDSWMGTRHDGKEIIVRPWNKLDSAFYILNVQTGELVSRLWPKLPYLNDPHFSPDGKQVVFRGSMSLSKKERKHPDELYLIDADGKNLRQLTHYPASDTTAEWYAYHAGPPFWEANGDFISYMSKQQGRYSIFTIRPDGTEGRRLSANELEESYHAWSPSGNWLAMEMVDTSGNYDIFLTKPDGSEAKRLTDDPTFEQAPVFVRVPN